jgi:hypothetical protein
MANRRQIKIPQPFISLCVTLGNPWDFLIQKVYFIHKNFEFPFGGQRCEYKKTGPCLSRLVARILKIRGH